MIKVFGGGYGKASKGPVTQPSAKPGAKPGVGGKPTKGRPEHGEPSMEYEIVSRMQSMLHNLSDQAMSNPEGVLAAILKQTPDFQVDGVKPDAKNEAVMRKFRDTYLLPIGRTANVKRPREAQFDGEWGPSTISACKAAATLSKLVDGPAIEEGKHFRQDTAQNVADRADRNIKALVTLMRKLNLRVPRAAGDEFAEFDRLPRNPTTTNLDPATDTKELNVRTLWGDDLSALYKFYGFLQTQYRNIPEIKPMLQGLAGDREEYIKKVAVKIKDSFIIREGQRYPEGHDSTVQSSVREAVRSGEVGIEMEQQRAARRRQEMVDAREEALNKKYEGQQEGKEAQQEKQQMAGRGNWLTVSELDRALTWFGSRANLWYNTARQRMRAGEVDPVTGDKYTEDDLAIKRKYHQAMQRLVGEWLRQRGDFLYPRDASGKPDRTKPEIDPTKAFVDPRFLLDRSETGATRGRGGAGGAGKGGKGYTGMWTIPGTNFQMDADVIGVPFPPRKSDGIDLRWLTRKFQTDNADWFQDNYGTGTITEYDLGRHPKNIYNLFRVDQNQIPADFWKSAMTQALQAIPQIYRTWYGRIFDRYPELRDTSTPEGAAIAQVAKGQQHRASEWLESIQSQLRQIERWRGAGGEDALGPKGNRETQEEGAARSSRGLVSNQPIIMAPPREEPAKVRRKVKYRTPEGGRYKEKYKRKPVQRRR